MMLCGLLSDLLWPKLVIWVVISLNSNQISAMSLVNEKIRREKVGSVPTLLLYFYCTFTVASREHIRLMENGL
jgi:hypothetical protein